MTLTLKEAITATQTTVDVDGTDTLSNGDLYTIEDEQVYIVGAYAGDAQPGATAWQRLNIQRGQLGTTEVGHSAGTVLTAVGIPLGDGVQTVRLLGPFPVAFNTAGIAVGGVLLATLDADTWIIAAWAHVKTEWNFDGPDDLNIEVAPVSDPGNSYYATLYTADPSDNISVQGDATVAVEAFTVGVGATPQRHMVGTVESSRLTCRTGTAASAGTADIYALIAEPG